MFVFVLLWAATSTEGARNYFHLRLWPAVLCFLPLPLLVYGFALMRRGRTQFGDAEWRFLHVGNFFVQFFAASLVAWSSTPGATIFCWIFLWAAGYHGHIHRITLTEPLMAVGTLVAGIAAMLLNPDPEHVAIFRVVIPAAVLVEIVAGTIAVRRLRIVVEAERLRAAVAAQILNQQDDEMQRISRTLVEVLAYNHDMNNALMSASLATEELTDFVEGHSNGELQSAAEDLRGSLVKLLMMVARVRERGTGNAALPPDVSVVSVEPVLASVMSNARARFTSVHVTMLDPGAAPKVCVRGGVLSLHRVLDNLVINACEGSGKAHAQNVTISVRRSVTGAAVEILVEDDGPGFTAEQLSRGIEGFKTSKTHGTGLGLYTSEQLVRASGGVLERSNRPQGGAVVRVTLPMEGT